MDFSFLFLSIFFSASIFEFSYFPLVFCVGFGECLPFAIFSVWRFWPQSACDTFKIALEIHKYKYEYEIEKWKSIANSKKKNRKEKKTKKSANESTSGSTKLRFVIRVSMENLFVPFGHKKKSQIWTNNSRLLGIYSDYLHHQHHNSMMMLMMLTMTIIIMMIMMIVLVWRSLILNRFKSTLDWKFVWLSFSQSFKGFSMVLHFSFAVISSKFRATSNLWLDQRHYHEQHPFIAEFSEIFPNSPSLWLSKLHLV